jgi:hypothetical protein
MAMKSVKDTKVTTGIFHKCTRIKGVAALEGVVDLEEVGKGECEDGEAREGGEEIEDAEEGRG